MLDGIFNGGVPVRLLVMSLIAVFVAAFLVYLVLERDPQEAARKTSDRGAHAMMGASSAAVVAAAEGLHVLAEAPGFVIGLLGLGGIAAGVSLEVAAAVFVSVYIVLAAIRGDQ